MTRRAGHLLVLLLAASAARAQDPALVPIPASVQRHAGAFRLSPATPVLVAPGDAVALRAAGVLVERIARTHGIALRVQAGAARDGAIVLVRRAAGAPGDESYRLDVTPLRITLSAATLAGLDHAGTTLWQWLGDAPADPLDVAAVRIDDAPRFPWRGLLLDSARHYQSPQFVLRFLDTMAAQKLNVLHWHLTDDQAWRLEIRKYPRLTTIGAWRVPAGPAAHADIDAATGKPRLYGGYYSQDEVRRIVRYAADRGITIVPEIEMPGHATAALVAYPALAATSQPPREVPSDWGAYPNLFNLDETTFTFLENVLTEVMALFPGRYIHVGGDEVDTAQWSASASTRARMHALGIADAKHIQPWFTGRIARFLASRGRRLVGWDEILAGELPASAVVMSWRGIDGTRDAAARGLGVVIATDPTLYFDHRQSAAATEPPGRAKVESLEDIYRFDPTPAALTDTQRRHVLGLQGNLWTEHVRTEERVGWMAFPRAAAIAELGWSRPGRLDWNDFRRRVGAMPARYAALGMSYARSAFEPPPAPATGPERRSQDLELCSDHIALNLEDDAPLHGPRAVFLVDIMNPCWIWRRARLDGVTAIEARVGQVPFNFQIGEDVNKIKFAKPVTAQGELEVHAGTCDGEVLARLPLAPATRSQGVTALPAAPIAAHSGAHDLCLRFAQPTLDPLWVLDALRLVGGAP